MRVLVTCPPMISMIEEFRPLFEAADSDFFVPDFVQVVAEDELARLLPEFDGWIIGDDPATRRVFESGAKGRLRAAVKWGIGTDNVDFTAAEEFKIPIVNTPGMFGNEVADVAMCYVTGLARELFRIDRSVRIGEWPKPTGVSLKNKSLGIVGYGDIGRQVAKRAGIAGMHITVYDPAFNGVPTIDGYELAEWPDRLSSLDFIVFTCSLTPENRHMFGSPEIDSVKEGLRLVNVARGQLIDERALMSGLSSGKIHSAALDVMDVEPLPASSGLREFENCIFGSHNSSNTREAVMATSQLAIERLFGFLGK